MGLCCLLNDLNAANHPIKVRAVPLPDLSQNSIWTMLQDSHGFLWFGTANGLNRYDGYRMKVYSFNPNHPDSLSNDWINTLYEDDRGRLWIGTRNGLNLFDWKTETFKHYFAGQPNGLPDNFIRSLLQDRQGDLWVGTQNGLARFDESSQTFTTYGIDYNGPFRLNHFQIHDLMEDRDGELWVATSRGISIFNKDRSQARHLSQTSDVAYHPELWSRVLQLHEQVTPLAAIQANIDDFHETKTFEIQKPTWALIQCTGEGTRFLTDFGSLSKGREPLWEMSLEHTKMAGGALKNRVEIGLVRLEPGTYTLHYLTDESHSPEAWNSQPPSQPNSWGIQIFPLEESDYFYFRAHLDRFYYKRGFPSGAITRFVEDQQGIIWIGTGLRGVIGYDKQKGIVAHYQHRGPRGVRRYPEQLWDELTYLVQNDRQLVATVHGGNHLNHSRTFTVDQATTVLISSMAEARGVELVDYGGLTRKGEPIWYPGIGDGKHAGGAYRNRIQFHVQTLPAGEYQLRQVSNSQHGYQRWVDDPPDHPEHWGTRILRLNDEEKKRLESLIARDVVPTVIPYPFIQCMAKGEQNQLWIGTSRGLSLIHTKSGQIDNFLPGTVAGNGLGSREVRSLCLDATRNLWIGTILGGASLIPAQGRRFQTIGITPATTPSLISPFVYSFTEDSQGLIWVGTTDGLSLWDPAAGRFLDLQRFFPNLTRLRVSINALITDAQGDVWIGSSGGGLHRFDPRLPEDATPENRTDEPVIHSYWPDQSQPGYIPSRSIGSFWVDRQERLWIGTFGSGLLRYDPVENRFLSYLSRTNPKLLEASHIRCIWQDRDDRLWIGSEFSGVYRYDEDRERFVAYRSVPRDATTVGHNKINSIAQDPAGNIWVATYGGGLNRFDESTQTFQRFTEDEGLPNNVIYGLLADDHHFWFSSNRGLGRFDPANGQVKVYDRYEGLQDNEFNSGSYLRTSTGHMLFGGVKGFNYFYPQDIRDNPHVPSMVITGVKVLDKPLLFDRDQEIPKITIDYTDTFISFEFASVDFINATRHQYAYRLDNLEKDWVYSGTRRYASYNHLSPGTYTFRVRGSNNDGVWNQVGRAIQITVRPPFWLTGWFFVLVLLSAFAMIVLALRYRRQKNQRERQRQEAFQKKLLQSQEIQRKRIGSEIHDGLGQNLLVINNEIQQLQQNPDPDRLAGISTLVLESIREARDIAYNLHPHHLDRLGLKRAVESVIKKIRRTCKTALQSDIDPIDGLFEKDVEISFYRIIQEAVSNIVKHSQASMATISIKRADTQVLVKVRDNGRGFDTANSDFRLRGFGLNGIAERVRLIGGTIRIQSEPGKGTTLDIRLPLIDRGHRDQRLN